MRFVPHTLIAIVLALSAASCQHKPKPSIGSAMVPKGTVTHVVIMYLRDRGDTFARDQVISQGEKLRHIEGVQGVVAGRMLPSDRPVVDTGYDMAFTMIFASDEDLQRYLNNPTHQAIKRDVLDRYVQKYVVYDLIAD